MSGSDTAGVEEFRLLSPAPLDEWVFDRLVDLFTGSAEGPARRPSTNVVAVH